MPKVTGNTVLKLKEAKSGHLMLNLVGDLKTVNRRSESGPSRLAKVVTE